MTTTTLYTLDPEVVNERLRIIEEAEFGTQIYSDYPPTGIGVQEDYAKSPAAEPLSRYERFKAGFMWLASAATISSVASYTLAAAEKVSSALDSKNTHDILRDVSIEGQDSTGQLLGAHTMQAAKASSDVASSLMERAQLTQEVGTGLLVLGGIAVFAAVGYGIAAYRDRRAQA